MVRKACQRAIDENIASLQKNFDQFKVNTPLISKPPESLYWLARLVRAERQPIRPRVQHVLGADDRVLGDVRRGRHEAIVLDAVARTAVQRSFSPSRRTSAGRRSGIQVAISRVVRSAPVTPPPKASGFPCWSRSGQKITPIGPVVGVEPFDAIARCSSRM